MCMGSSPTQAPSSIHRRSLTKMVWASSPKKYVLSQRNWGPERRTGPPPRPEPPSSRTGRLAQTGRLAAVGLAIQGVVHLHARRGGKVKEKAAHGTGRFAHQWHRGVAFNIAAAPALVALGVGSVQTFHPPVPSVSGPSCGPLIRRNVRAMVLSTTAPEGPPTRDSSLRWWIRKLVRNRPHTDCPLGPRCCT